MNPPLPASLSRTFVHQQFVALVARQSARVPVAVFGVALAIAAITSQHMPLIWSGAWFLLAVALMLLRWRTLAALPSRDDLDGDGRMRLVVLLSAANGAVFGLSSFAFPLLSVAERSLHSMLLVGLASGAVATTGGHLRTFLAYVLPTLLPLAVLWAWSPGLAQPGWIERAMAPLVLIYIWLLVGLARDAWRTFVESCEIRFQERELNERLQAALDRADAASRAKTRFLAAASHDLRQPLHTITLLGAALAMRRVDARSKEIVTLLNEVTDTLTAQLDGLLDISKLDAGIVQAELKPLKLADLVSQHFAEIEGLARAKGLDARLVVKTDALVHTDAQLLLRVLRNLTQNAIKFTDSGHIGVALRPAGDGIELTVSDTGRGISAEHREQVFQEFYQVENPERDRSKGLGLGLSIVQRLCDLLGIGLRMHSEPGAGTRFTLTLARASEAPRAAGAPSRTGPEQAYELRVLVIDDEKSVRVGLRILLEELGCECIEAASTDEARELVRQRPPDLVLADFRLRGDDSGIRAIEAVRALWPGVHVVLVSGDTAPDRLVEAERAGLRLLHKPLPLEALQRELRAAQLKRQDAKSQECAAEQVA